MKKTLAWRQRRYSISIDIQIQEQACFLSLLTLLQAQSWRARIKKKNQLCAEETAHTFHGEEHNAEPTGVSEKRKMQEEV